MGLFKKKHKTAGFIKHGTAGTSNEISFSVLDSMSTNAGTQAPGSAKTQLGQLELYTLSDKKESAGPSGVAQIGDEDVPTPKKAERSAEDEIKARKRKRRRSKIAFACAAIVAVGLLVFAVYGYVVNDIKNNQTYEGILNQALEEIQLADETLSVMDSSFSDLLSEESMSNMEAAQAGFAECTKHLDQAQACANRAAENFTSANEKEVSAQAQNSISARREMMDVGKQIIDLTQEANQAIEYMQSAWDSMILADSHVRTAIQTVSSLEAGAVSAAQSELNSAKTCFADAQSYYANVESTYPDEDFSLYDNYIEARLVAIGYLQAALTAVSDEDTETASAQMEEYNTADANATSIAAGMPSDVAQPIRDILTKNLEPLSESYSNACSQAAKADYVLRNYINNN
jgi:hypothetical protein